jgi:hypothetical protein
MGNRIRIEDAKQIIEKYKEERNIMNKIDLVFICAGNCNVSFP